ncbi:hypothetical protein [Naasia lichenicola]|uniref:hypothetical protein n=1 Tax=Naasia lichenicola TaxID=2565933 RepID=UPI00130DB590|nr:hypothetical protein [Naasia lichenicola]
MAEIEQCSNEDCELFERPVLIDDDLEDADSFDGSGGQLGICPACGVTREYA